MHGYIDGVECDVCPEAYKYQDKADISGSYPKTKEEIEKYNI